MPQFVCAVRFRNAGNKPISLHVIPQGYVRLLINAERERETTTVNASTALRQSGFKQESPCLLTTTQCSNPASARTPTTPPPSIPINCLLSTLDKKKHIISDVESWSSLEDPIANLLCRAAFYVVEHPSPPTRAELAVARDNDYHAKVRLPLSSRRGDRSAAHDRNP